MIVLLLLALAGCHFYMPPDGSYDNKADVAGVEKQELTQQIRNLALPQEELMTRSITYRMDALKSEGVVQIVRFNQDRYYSVTHMVNGE